MKSTRQPTHRWKNSSSHCSAVAVMQLRRQQCGISSFVLRHDGSSRIDPMRRQCRCSRQKLRRLLCLNAVAETMHVVNVEFIARLRRHPRG